jgi:hydrogenase expression/formation protein HypE
VTKGGTHGRSPRPFRLRAVLFDFDGTLTVPGALDFAAIKRQVGCPADALVLEWIEALPAGPERDEALAALGRFELAGAAESAPNEGAEALVGELRSLGLKVGVLTRNGLPAVERALEGFAHLTTAAFDVVLTRDDRVPPKPAPDGVLHAAERMGVSPAETLMVGDYVLDMTAGREAGAVTAFLTNGSSSHESTGMEATAESAAIGADARTGGGVCDFVVHRLAELREVARLGLPLPEGKLPNDLLRRHLDGLAVTDDAVLVAAGVGEDVAALDTGEVDTIVVHGDPITLASGDLGRFAVVVNANDIAASGAEPRWLLTTVLLPAGTTPSQALALLRELADAASAQGVTIVGGHTEVAGAVTRPMVAATTIGVVRREELRDKHAARAGDHILITKGLAVEGAALLARELDEHLSALGMSDAELTECRDLLDQVSIVPEARIAAGCTGVRAMHDITEGGLATALRELATATGRDLVVHRERVPILPQAERLCALLGADPFGLIGSGSLLICCDPAEVDALMGRLAGAGIAVSDIGELGSRAGVSGPSGGGSARAGAVVALLDGRPTPWPEFAVDEAARVLSKAHGA